MLPFVKKYHYQRPTFIVFHPLPLDGSSKVRICDLRLRSFPHFCRPNTRSAYFSPAIITSSQDVNSDSYLYVKTGSSSNPRLVRALRPDGKRNWMTEDAFGVQFSIAPKQILISLKPPSENGLPGDLAAFQESAENQAKENEDLLEVVWEDMMNQDDLFDIDTICELLFSEISPLSLLATYLLLMNDEIFFKSRSIKGAALYETRPVAIVEENKARQVEQNRLQTLEQRKREQILHAYKSRSFEALNACFSQSEMGSLAESLRGIALELDNGKQDVDTRYTSAAGTAFSTLGRPERALVELTMSVIAKPIVPFAAFDVLVEWKQLHRHENLSLLRSGLAERRSSSPTILKAAEELFSDPPQDIDSGIREDLRHIPSFAVDSSDTTEVDDAIAFDLESNCIYVHVADPSRFFSETDHVVLRKAFERAATLYLPTGKLTMFPEILANDVFSLGGRSWNGEALTILFRIANDGTIEPESSRIVPSLISAPVRLTYEEAHKAIEDTENEYHDTFRQLLEIALRRREWREMEGGALLVNTPFSIIQVTEPDLDEPKIQIGVTEADTGAWIFVSELMITACTAGALIAQNAKIPLPFRSQEPFEYPEEDIIQGIPDGPARATVVFRNAAPSVTTTEPMEHASLGVDSYVQLTSPIRRSLDLLAHFQIKAFVRGGEYPFSEEEVRSEITRNQEVGRELRQIENKARKYWQLEFLKRQGAAAEHRAIFLRTLKDDDRLALVYLLDYGIQLAASVPPRLKLATEIRVRIPNVNPRTGVVRAVCVFHIEEEEKKMFEEALDEAFSDLTTEDAVL